MASGNINAVALSNGDRVPGFTLFDEKHKKWTLEELMGSSGLLMVFVRGTWCAQCVQTLYNLARQAPGFARMRVNTAVIAIDSEHSLNSFKQTASLPLDFPLLADEDQTVRQHYGVNMSEVYLLIDREGTLRTIFLDPDGLSRPNSQAIRTAITLHLEKGLEEGSRGSATK